MRILLLILTFICFENSFSQTNRYSTISTSTYTPAPTPSRDYYRAVSENRIKRINEAMSFYDINIENNLNLNTDYEFKQDMLGIYLILQDLKDAKSMNLDQAEHLVNTMTKKYNKAIKNYNKRLKKANK